jgi:hypothetical protein
MIDDDARFESIIDQMQQFEEEEEARVHTHAGRPKQQCTGDLRQAIQMDCWPLRLPCPSLPSFW